MTLPPETDSAERRREVQRRLTRGDETMESLRPLITNPFARSMLRLLGADVAALDDAYQSMDGIITTATRAVEFAELGWAPCSCVPSGVYEAALAHLDAGEPSEAEVTLVRGWNDHSVLRYMPMRMRVLGAADDELRDIALKRSDLVQKAWTDHTEGRFHASIPVVMMVVDGVCADATGGQFFSLGRSAADVADDSTLAGMSDSLPVVRRALAQRFDSTVASGALNRHGTLHGRELAYDTLTNSTKAFVLLVAVWEWAKPLLDAEAERRRASRLAMWAGSDEVDSDGRRMDRRGFSATRLLLKDVALAQVASHRQHGRFGTERELNEDAVARSLRPHDDRAECIRSDGDSWVASHRSESGWVFALGAPCQDPSDWRYWDGPEHPTTSPDGWASTATPNWSGDCT